MRFHCSNYIAKAVLSKKSYTHKLVSWPEMPPGLLSIGVEVPLTFSYLNMRHFGSQLWTVYT